MCDKFCHNGARCGVLADAGHASALIAYLLVTRRLFARATESAATAATVALCAMLIWIGLFDIIHPGIGWR
jgi:hypothetical protein